MHRRAHAFFALASLALAGCGLTLDLDPPDPQGGDRLDAGSQDGGGGDAGAPPDPCEGRPDGTACSDSLPLLCVGGECEVSTCGDGVVDARAGERCDDGNESTGDGCEPIACAPTCTTDAECDDGNPCDGVEFCNPAITKCEPGAPPAGTIGCVLRDGTEGSCDGGFCVPFGCGNGIVEDGEECDDENLVSGDGCERDCRLSCREDAQCQDDDRCNGEEHCVASTGCAIGTPIDCFAPDACHAAMCSPRAGCEAPLIDADHDGRAPAALGECGGDCDDADPARYAGATERCNDLDDDCDDAIDEDIGQLECFFDRDADGFGDDATRVVDCVCPDGAIPTRGDCFDAPNPIGAAVRPDQTTFFRVPYCRDDAGAECSFDYDCDGVEERQLEAVHRACSALTVLTRCTGQGWSGNVPACGEEGTWVECDGLLGPLGLVCTARETRRVQQCR